MSARITTGMDVSPFELLSISEDKAFHSRRRICKDVWPPSSIPLCANLSLARERSSTKRFLQSTFISLPHLRKTSGGISLSVHRSFRNQIHPSTFWAHAIHSPGQWRWKGQHNIAPVLRSGHEIIQASESLYCLLILRNPSHSRSLG